MVDISVCPITCLVTNVITLADLRSGRGKLPVVCDQRFVVTVTSDREREPVPLARRS